MIIYAILGVILHLFQSAACNWHLILLQWCQWGMMFLFYAWAPSRMDRLSKYYSNFRPAHPPAPLFYSELTFFTNSLTRESPFSFWMKSEITFWSTSMDFFILELIKIVENYAIYFVVDAARCSASICLKTKVNRSWPFAISTVRVQL